MVKNNNRKMITSDQRISIEVSQSYKLAATIRTLVQKQKFLDLMFLSYKF